MTTRIYFTERNNEVALGDYVVTRGDMKMARYSDADRIFASLVRPDNENNLPVPVPYAGVPSVTSSADGSKTLTARFTNCDFADNERLLLERGAQLVNERGISLVLDIANCRFGVGNQNMQDVCYPSIKQSPPSNNSPPSSNGLWVAVPPAFPGRVSVHSGTAYSPGTLDRHSSAKGFRWFSALLGILGAITFAYWFFGVN